ncbi:hypothetical protein [Halanaerobacter jeridensis]|uniref:Uncharacterized protein n=1 Tax=Halanaerobacter jeridensis TaxID=706427 RepID=A0A939BS49_9FIRM|nr:hypothetical protein [Halanaerobacter jeridensis]MBM7557994.1 hypothetical protein [Halanaerobacter jeridensis]
MFSNKCNIIISLIAVLLLVLTPIIQAKGEIKSSFLVSNNGLGLKLVEYADYSGLSFYLSSQIKENKKDKTIDHGTVRFGSKYYFNNNLTGPFIDGALVYYSTSKYKTKKRDLI